MDMEDKVVIPAQGRPFELGMLYDLKRNQLIPEKIWLDNDIEKVKLIVHIINCISVRVYATL